MTRRSSQRLLTHVWRTRPPATPALPSNIDQYFNILIYSDSSPTSGARKAMGYEGAGPGGGHKEANDADCFSIVCFHRVLRICVGNSVPIYSVPFRTGYFWYFLDLNFFWVNSIITACKDFIESSIHLWYIEEFASFCVCVHFGYSNTYMRRNIGRTVLFSTFCHKFSRVAVLLRPLISISLSQASLRWSCARAVLLSASRSFYCSEDHFSLVAQLTPCIITKRYCWY